MKYLFAVLRATLSTTFGILLLTLINIALSVAVASFFYGVDSLEYLDNPQVMKALQVIIICSGLSAVVLFILGGLISLVKPK